MSGSSAPTQTPPTDRATAYAQAVVSGAAPAGRLVRLCCERHLRDLEHAGDRGLRWHPEAAEYAIVFFRFLTHSKGEWARRPIELADWQAFIVGSIFGWKREDGTRRFRTVYEEVGRKNGKSTKLAGVGLYALLADGELGAEVYAAATKKDQAEIIFGEAKRMARSSMALRSRLSIFKRNLSVDATASKFEPLSADEKTLDGLNPHCVLIDELHKHKNRGVLDVMDTAVGSRRQPLIWIITTAGDDNPETVYAQENDYAVKVLEGVLTDDSYFAYIATLDKEDRWDDPAVWVKANPNLGISVKLDDLQRQARKARGSPSAQAAFKRLRLNVRSGSIDRAIPIELWRANSEGTFDPAEMHGRPCYVGLDLSSKIDISALVKLFPPQAGEERWRVVARFWMPADTVSEKADRDRAQYSRWIEEGWIEATPGNVIDHNEIQSAILEDARLHEFRGMAYDPWNATQLAVKLQEEGVQVYEFIQGIRSYTAPTKELLAMLTASKIEHGGNPVLEWMAFNMKLQSDKNENLMPTKKHSVGRIDGMTALIMSIGLTITAEDSTIYSDGRDIRFA